MALVPDEWLKRSDMLDFKPTNDAYNSSGILVPISGIRPPRRNPGVRDFDQEQMLAILNGFASGTIIPPIKVFEARQAGEWKYEVYDGFHRFHASVSVGFKSIPVEVIQYGDLNALWPDRSVTQKNR